MDLITPENPAEPELTLDALEAVVARLALADPTRIVALRVAACRFCHGHDHEYQWRTEREFLEQRARTQRMVDLAGIGLLHLQEIEDTMEPNDSGGYGYSRLLPPNPDCPECDGFGVEWVQMTDHTKLRPHERALLNGVKQNSKGEIEVKIERKSTYLKALTELLKLRLLGEDSKGRDRIQEILAIAAVGGMEEEEK